MDVLWNFLRMGGLSRTAFAAQWLVDGSAPARGRRAWAWARRSVAGIGRPGFPTMRRADGGRVTAAIPGNGTGGSASALARLGRRAAAGLLLAFAALLAMHLQAQAQTTYVSNLNQTGTDTGLDAMHGQSFTTGDQAGGYQLGSVAVRMHYLAPGTTMTVSIYNTDTNGYPTTLEYALTAPSTIPYNSTVYFDAPTGATLDAGTTYSVVFAVSATTFFYITASDAEDTAEAGWSIADVVSQKTNSVWADRLHAEFSVQLAIIGLASSNSAPIFTEGDSTSRETVETINNTPEITARNIGTPVAATDPDTIDTLAYSLEGDAADKFEIVTNTGLITTKIGESYDYETKTSYSVRVKVVDGNSGSDTIDVTLNFLNQEEPPPVLRQPTVTATQGSTTSLDVSWPAPLNIGRPEITSYDVQYKRSQDSTWTDGPQDDVTTTSTSIAGLETDASYDVRVRATNADGNSRLWSQLGTGRTGSTDATLRFLRLHVRSTGMPLALNETFASTLKEYTADVANAVTLITIVPTTSDSSATVAYLNVSAAPLMDEDENWPNFQVALADGANTIKLKVTAHDRNTTDTYTLTVTRAVTTSTVTTPTVRQAGTASCEPGVVWCATLYVKALNGGHFGCANSQLGNRCSNPSHFTKDEFNHASTDYDVTSVRVSTNGQLQLWIDPALVTATQSLVLHVGSQSFPFLAADENGAKNRYWNNSGLTWAAGEAVALKLTEAINAPATGKPKISDTAEVSQTLTANTGDIEDPDGKTKAENGDAGYAYTYQWIRVDGTTETAIPGANSKTYTLVQADEGKTLKVEVSFTDDAGNSEEPLTSHEYIVVGVAAGTITDAIPKAWIARFGRTVADQTLNAVEGRMTKARAPGTELKVAGQRVDGSAAPEEVRASEAEAGLEALAEWLRGEEGEDRTGFESRAVTGRDVLTGSSFALTEGSAEGGFGAVWGRGAISRFDGRDGDLTLDGEVASAIVGADWTGGRGSVGLAVAHSRGEGGYRSPSGGGAVESTLTGVYPYGRYDVSEWLSVRGIAGYGTGTLTLTPDGMAPIEIDMDLSMAAVGGRSVVVKPPLAVGIEVLATADAMVVRTSSDEVRGSAGSLAASEAEVTRVRLGLEGSWRGIGTEGGGSLVPGFEIGVRHDGGDAETGFGADIGVGLAWSDPAHGIAADVSARGLLTHEDGSFRERGFAASFAWDPTPSSDLGPRFMLSQTVGASAAGGMEALLGPQTAPALGAANDEGDDLLQRRIETRFGYGFPLFGGRYTGTPEIGFGLMETGREYIHSWRLAEARSEGFVFGLDAEGARRESVTDDGGPEYRIGLGLGWRLEGARREDLALRFETSRQNAANDDRTPEYRIGLRMSARW